MTNGNRIASKDGIVKLPLAICHDPFAQPIGQRDRLCKYNVSGPVGQILREKAVGPTLRRFRLPLVAPS